MLKREVKCAVEYNRGLYLLGYMSDRSVGVVSVCKEDLQMLFLVMLHMSRFFTNLSCVVF